VTGTLQSFTRGTLTTRPVAVAALLLAGAAAVAAAIGVAAPWPTLLRGWLLGFAIWSSIPIGSMTLLLIHRLTGGRWGLAAAPVLRPTAAMMPMVVLAFVPVLVGLSLIYPWAADPAAIPHDVARWYLNGTFFALRSIVALTGWMLLGVIFATAKGSRLLAALGLAFFGLTISLVAVDWYLSLEPHYVASAFAAMIAIQQLLAATALTALLGSPQLEGEAAADIGGLLITMLLGVVYLGFMTFLVAWYGDLPDKAEWFLKRSTPLWTAVLITALLVGALLPFAMLLLRAVRASRRGLRIAASLILAGTALHYVWLIVPAFDDQLAVVAAAVVILILFTAVSVLQGPRLSSLLEARHAE
jgi:hypothetical protein